MNNFLLDAWQQLTGQVCLCKHTKQHHIKLGEGFDTRSDVQCLNFIFTGGAYGEHGSLSCCQCLHYTQRKLVDFYLIRVLMSLGRKSKPLPKAEECFCVCGHNAIDHDIEKNFDVIYPPCTKCDCKKYDYVNNPHIGNE